MKKFLPLLAFVFLLMAFQCEEDSLSNQEQDQQELIDLQKSIETLATLSVCNETSECKFIGFGSKSCG